MATKKQPKPSKGFVKEMERMYPNGATISPTKSKTAPKAAPKAPKKK